MRLIGESSLSHIRGTPWTCEGREECERIKVGYGMVEVDFEVFFLKMLMLAIWKATRCYCGAFAIGVARDDLGEMELFS